jgi:hypothetical protein
MVPQGYPGIVPIHAPENIAKRLVEFTCLDSSNGLRQHFITHYTETQSVEAMRAALRNWASAKAA